MRRRPVWWRWAGAAAVALAVGWTLWLALAGAGGPASPLALAPADGSTLAHPPGQVSLSFTAGAPPRQVHLSVSSTDGRPVPTGAATMIGQAVVVPVTITGPARYLLGYHVELADGTQRSGLASFTVAAPEAPAPDPSALAAPAPVAADQVLAGDGHSHPVADPVSAVGLGLDAVLLVALVVMLVRRPRGRR